MCAYGVQNTFHVLILLNIILVVILLNTFPASVTRHIPPSYVTEHTLLVVMQLTNPETVFDIQNQDISCMVSYGTTLTYGTFKRPYTISRQVPTPQFLTFERKKKIFDNYLSHKVCFEGVQLGDLQAISQRILSMSNRHNKTREFREIKLNKN